MINLDININIDIINKLLEDINNDNILIIDPDNGKFSIFDDVKYETSSDEIIPDYNLLYENNGIKLSPRRKLLRDRLLIACRSHDYFLYCLPLSMQYDIVKLIECSCLKYTLEKLSILEHNYNEKYFVNNKIFINEYSAVYYKIISNIDKVSSVSSCELIAKISDFYLNEPARIDDLPYMTSAELSPNKNDELRKIVYIRQNIQIDKKFSQNYTCPRCKLKKAVYTETQRRSADEAADIRLECTGCGCIWYK